MTDFVRIHVVRHGETTWNAQRRVQGQVSDVPLTELGRRQTAAVLDALADRPVVAVYSSDLLRALETARPIARHHGLPVVREPALRERHLGALQGRLLAEVEEELKDVARERWYDPDFTYGGAESQRELYERVSGFLERLRKQPPGGEIVLVTHAGPLRVAAAYASGVPVEQLRWRPLPNGALETLRLDETTRERRAQPQRHGFLGTSAGHDAPRWHGR